MSLSEVFQDALRNHFSGSKPGGIEPLELLTTRENFLSRIHYSWFEEVLSALPPLEQELLKTSLPISIGDKLGRRSNKIPPIFAGKLAELMGLNRFPPPVLLVKGPFFPLLDYDKEALTDLISLLPFPLLTPQIKKIVDKKRLLGIYSLLTDSQKELLKLMLIRPDQGSLVGLDLSTWKGSSSELEAEIHKKGIHLLAQATAGEGDSFRFYLSRILDRGRGKMLLDSPKENIAKDPAGLLHAVMKYCNQRKTHVPATKT